MARFALTYIAGDTPVHRCDARAKILLLFAYSVGIFIVRTWWGIGLFALTAAVAAALARFPAGTLNRMLGPVYVLAAFSVAFNVVASPDAAGLGAGLFLGLRMVLLVAASFVACLTSSSSDLLEAFRWIIGPLRHLRVPVDDAAFTLSLALRFIPLIEREFDVVRMAQKARGADIAGSLPRRLRIWGAAFSSVFVGLFRHADTLADAMDARCYGAPAARTRLPR